MSKKNPKRYLHVTMPDGSVWEVPVSVIAKNREATYKGTCDLSDEANSDLLAKIFEEEADDYDVTDWASGNMNWSDVESVAKQVSPPPPPNFQEGWMNGKKEIIIR